MSERTHPIEGQVVLLAGAQASVTLQQLSRLLERVQRHLAGQRDHYERRFEYIEGVDTGYFLTDIEHWDHVADDLSLDESQSDAVRRAHEAQFQRDGRRLDRSEEFETILEIRQPVAIAEL